MVLDSKVNGVLNPSNWETVGRLEGYWTPSQNTLNLVSFTGLPVVRINVNIWYYEPCDVCSMSQGYISYITLVSGGKIMFTSTSDIVITISMFLDVIRYPHSAGVYLLTIHVLL